MNYKLAKKIIDKVRYVPHWNMFTAAKNRLASNQNTKLSVLKQLSLKFNIPVQQRVAENSTTSSEILDSLADHESADVRLAVAQNANTFPSTIQTLAGDVNSDVRYAMAADPRTNTKLLETLADDENAYVQDRAKRTQVRIRDDQTQKNAQLKNAAHPFSRSFPNLFCSGPFTSKSTKAKQESITLSDLAALPKQTQLLVAHCLGRNNPNLTLLESDAELAKLVSTGWLISIPVSTIGIKSLMFKPHFWRQLRSLRLVFVQPLQCELEQFRRQKTAHYPWVW